MTTNLTAKQARFVEEYLCDLNATQAAIRAGYKPHRADAISYENLILSRPSRLRWRSGLRAPALPRTGSLALAQVRTPGVSGCPKNPPSLTTVLVAASTNTGNYAHRAHNTISRCRGLESTRQPRQLSARLHTLQPIQTHYQLDNRAISSISLRTVIYGQFFSATSRPLSLNRPAVSLSLFQTVCLFQ